MFNPEMMVLARESRGLSQSALADRIGLSQGLLSKIENGLTEASEEVAHQIAEGLSYPPAFFRQEDVVYGLPITFHRKRKTAPVKVVTRAGARIQIQVMQIRRLLRAVSVEPEVPLPTLDVDEYGGPETVAQVMRSVLKVPTGPIRNLTAILERAGIIVVKFDFGSRKLDAVGVRVPNLPPLIFLSNSIPMDRARFTMSHELGHLVMHQVPTPEMEAEADAFAAEFLMPAAEIRKELQDLSIRRLANLKLRWRVAMSALLFRASTLRTISERQARYFWYQLGKRGYKTAEPAEIEPPQETPTLLRSIIEAHRRDLSYSDEEISRVTLQHPDDFRQAYAGQGANLRLSVIS